MANDDPIEKKPLAPAGSPGLENRALGCEEWESLAAEALDGSLGEARAAAFAQHRRQCPSCAQAWERSRRGAEWLRFLDDRPQPPAGLVDAILAATSGNLLPDSVHEPAGSPPFWRGSPLAAPRPGSSRMEVGAGVGAPGLFMTAAMAFFSLALTLSLLSGSPRAASPTGARSFSKTLLSSLSPSSLGEMATRQYYSLEERGAKFYDNLPLVRELEAEAPSISNETPPEGGMAPAPRGMAPRSRNGGGASLPWASGPGETAVNWRGGLRPRPSYLETYRLVQPGQPRWSRS